VTKNYDKSWIGNDGGEAAQELQVNNNRPFTFSAQLTRGPRFAPLRVLTKKVFKKISKKNFQKKQLSIVFETCPPYFPRARSAIHSDYRTVSPYKTLLVDNENGEA
jgi:hypothetical protein